MQKAVLAGGGGGDGFNSGGSMLTLSREESDMVMSEEGSSSYPDESELELGLELSLGGGGGGGGRARAETSAVAAGGGSWGQYSRILTAKDFTSAVSTNAASSSSSSSPVTKANNYASCGTKRTAEPSSPPGRSGVSQVVGWPPIGNYRMNSLANHAKSLATEESASTVDICKSVKDKANYRNSSRKNSNVAAKEIRGTVKTSLFVKVNMDGIPIGRKVDLNAHSCYETLAHTLDDMFRLGGTRRSNVEDQVVMAGAGRPVRLLDGSSDFVLTYEDKEGDWMLVGDVPWEMFLSSVRRLGIRRTTEANGLAPRSR